MNLGLFILYYLICTIILIIITLFVLKFVFKKKFNLVSRVAERTIEDYFNAYDLLGDEKDTLDLTDNFDEQIHIIDEEITLTDSLTNDVVNEETE